MGITAGDHVDCLLTQGNSTVTTSWANGLYITGNTFMCDLSQTSAILLGSEEEIAQYMLVDRNFLAGGSYTIYGGSTTDASIRIDTGQAVTVTGTTVTDTAAVSGDVGATITCTTGGIFAANTHIVSVSGTTYTLSQATTNTGSGLTFEVQQNYGTRTDVGCGSANSVTVTDPSAVAGDLGAAVTNTTTPASIPSGTTISSVNPGTGYTLSAATTGGTLTGQTFSIHFSNNIQFTNNRISTAYFPDGGSAGFLANYDQYGAGNVWSNNVVHDTGVQIPA